MAQAALWSLNRAVPCCWARRPPVPVSALARRARPRHAAADLAPPSSSTPLSTRRAEEPPLYNAMAAGAAASRHRHRSHCSEGGREERLREGMENGERRPGREGTRNGERRPGAKPRPARVRVSEEGAGSGWETQRHWRIAFIPRVSSNGCCSSDPTIGNS